MELAAAALARVPLHGPETGEQIGVAVDRHRRLLAHVPGRDRQEPGGIDIPCVRNEHDAVSVSDAEAPPDGGAPDGGLVKPFRPHSNGRHPAKVGGLRRLDGERGSLGEVVQPVVEHLALAGPDLSQISATPRADQIEETPPHDPQTQEEPVDFRQARHSIGGNQGVDLKRNPRFPDVTFRLHGGREAALHAAEPIVDLGRSTVDAERHALDPARF